METEGHSGSGSSNIPLIAAVLVAIFFLALNGPLVNTPTSQKTLADRNSPETTDDSDYYNSETETEIVFKENKNHPEISVREDRRLNSVEAIDEVKDYRVPLLNLLSVQNLETNSALIRGAVDLHDHETGVVFVVYGYNESRVSTLAQSYKSSERTETSDDRALVGVIDSSVREAEDFSYRLSGLIPETTYYYQVCVEYNYAEAILKICAPADEFKTAPERDSNNYFSNPSISIGSAYYITDRGATFSVNLNMNDGVSGIPFIVYGESETLVKAVDSKNSFSSVLEDDEDLKKKRLGVGLRGRSEMIITLDDLDKRTEYFYRACVEFDGDRDVLICDGVKSFETDIRSQADKPIAKTGNAKVEGNTVTLSGSIDMGDFRNGLAFMIYGTDSEAVVKGSERGSFSSINQTVDKLQKVVIADNGVSGDKKYQTKVTDLIPSATYFYRLCVEYEDEDKYNSLDQVLSCGAVLSF